MSFPTGWLIAGALVIATLAGYAFYLQLQLNKREQENTRRVDALLAEQAARRESAVESMVVIGRAMKEQQCAISEGCIRLSALLTQVDPSHQDNRVYSPFFQVADALSHIPVLAQWKLLEKKQKSAFLLEIKEVENRYQAFVELAVTELLKEYAPQPASETSAVQYFG